MKDLKIALIGDRDPAKKAHQGIEASLTLCGQEGNFRVSYSWIPTGSITPESSQTVLREATAIWCVPGSPYESAAGALLAIQHARATKTAFLGTCGGFQHALMEYARNALHREAAHQELTPAAKEPLIVKLRCSLVETKAKVIASRSGRFAEILGAQESMEDFHCNYGISQDLVGIFSGSDLDFVAHDEAGEIRAFRLKEHPFFVGTLFQPERKALSGSLHPVVRAFFQAASSVD